MLRPVPVAIDRIHVPAKRWRELDKAKVAALAEDILENGLGVPIRIREDGERYVLVEGLHRLEACRSLGEPTIAAVLAQARIR